MPTTTDPLYIAEAYSYGKDRAEAAASWTTDGNTSDRTARDVLAMIENGDPAMDDHLPAMPNLSGEWADDLTPFSLAAEIVPRDVLDAREPGDSLVDDLADAFERGVDEHFLPACENYETWAVGMFLDGNYDGVETYRAALETIQAAADAPNTVEVWTDEQARRFRVADALQAFTEEAVTSDDYDGLRGDLLNAALSEVDWSELAENKLSALSE